MISADREMLAAGMVLAELEGAPAPEVPGDLAGAMDRMRQTASALREWRRQFDSLPAPAIPLVAAQGIVAGANSQTHKPMLERRCSELEMRPAWPP